jgi:hypothetical protein
VEPRLVVKPRIAVGAIAWWLEIDVRLLRVRETRRAWKGRRMAGRRTWSAARRITTAIRGPVCGEDSRVGGKDGRVEVKWVY